MDILWLCEETRRPVPLHDCLECARQRDLPACPFPPTMLRALARSMEGDAELVEAKALAKRAGVALLRVTSLLGCTRQAWYGLSGPPPLERPSRHWSRLRGTIFHAALESLAGEETVAEARLVTSLEPFGVQAWIAGKADHYDPVTGQISDYKSVNSYGKKLANLGLPKQQHVAQLWIYGWLLGKAGYPYPATGRLIYLDMGTVYACDVAMPDPELQAQVEARIVEKARLITEADAAGPAGDPRKRGSAGIADTPTPSPTSAVAVVKPGPAQGLNVRAGPGTGYPVLDILPAGSRLTVVGRSMDGRWVEVCCVRGGARGWVAAELVALPAPAGNAPKR